MNLKEKNGKVIQLTTMRPKQVAVTEDDFGERMQRIKELGKLRGYDHDDWGVRPVPDWAEHFTGTVGNVVLEERIKK